MGRFLQIGYFLVGIVQFFAVWDGVGFFFGSESFFGRMIAFFFALFVTYIPLLGSGIGVYGAVNAWDWTLVKSLILFFWYVPFFIALMAYGAVADRR